MSKASVFVSAVAVALVAGGGAYYYYQPVQAKPAPAAVQVSNNELIFTAPPRESAEVGNATYKPIADYLSKVIGKKVVYKHSATWGVYRTEMLNDSYDITFDGPHFLDYRIQKFGHHALAKIEQPLAFSIIVPRDDKIDSPSGLAGKTFCGQSPPNLGSLTALSQFDNPSRQPVFVPTKGWKEIYDNVVSRRCAGGVIATANLKKFDKDGLAKVIYQSKGVPNQAFSASSRVTPEDRAKIAAALAGPDAAVPTERLRARFNVGEGFVAANNEEFAGIAQLLRNEFGFESIAANSVASK
jgi:ABC-type phosphate/phosphonate transport system substrate-binding protein